VARWLDSRFISEIVHGVAGEIGVRQPFRDGYSFSGDDRADRIRFLLLSSLDRR